MTLAATAAAPRSKILTGILLLIAGYQVLCVMDAAAKYLSTDYSVWQIVWARFFFHVVMMAPLMLARHGLGAVLRMPNQGLQMLRGTVMLAATCFFYFSLSTTPLADAISLAFVSPLVVTLLSPWVLGETVGWRRRAAVVVGFTGALIVVRPGFQTVELGLISAMLCGVCFALYILMTRKLSGTAPPLVSLGYTAFLGTVVMSAAMLIGGDQVWKTPDLTAFGLMCLMGLCAAGGHFLLISAFSHAPASLLAPFGYSEIVSGTLLGFLLFGNFPDLWTWVGMSVIVASGVYISLRERRARG